MAESASAAVNVINDEDQYVCKLDAASEEKAKRELNEDPNERLKAVQALRIWLQEQPRISFYTGL
jgi:hypothetical protein